MPTFSNELILTKSLNFMLAVNKTNSIFSKLIWIFLFLKKQSRQKTTSYINDMISNKPHKISADNESKPWNFIVVSIHPRRLFNNFQKLTANCLIARLRFGMLLFLSCFNAQRVYFRCVVDISFNRGKTSTIS